MANVPYDGGVPTTAPDTRLPDDFQRVDASPASFGGLIAQGAQQLGVGASKAGQFFAQAAVDDQINHVMTAAQAIRYGDPTQGAKNPDGSPILGSDGTPQPDTGFLGKSGADAMHGWQPALKQLDSVIAAGRQNLSTPEQQLQFDEQTRKLRSIWADEIGKHADDQSKLWMGTVSNAGATHALNGIAANPDDAASIANNANDLINFRVKAAEVAYGDSLTPDVKSQIVIGARQEALRTQLDAISVKDPARAMAMLEKNRQLAGVDYDRLATSFRPRAEEQQSETAAQAAITRALGRAWGNPSLPVFAQAASATPGGMSPTGMARTVQIESSGNPNAGLGTAHQGLIQAGTPYWARYGQGSPLDPREAIFALSRSTAADRQYLSKKLGRDPTDAELYIAHQQGPGGAEKLLLNPNANAASLVGRAAVVGNGGNANMTAQQFTNLWTAKFSGVSPYAFAGDGSTMTMPEGVSGAQPAPPASAAAAAVPDELAPTFTQPTLASFEQPAGQAVSAPPTPPPAPPLQPIAPQQATLPTGSPSPTAQREDAIQSILNDPNLSPRVREMAYGHVNRYFSEQAAASATRVSELRSSLPDIVAAAEAGVPGVSLPSNEIWSTLPPAEAQKWTERFAIAQHVGNAMGAMRWASPADVGRMQADISSGQGALSEAMKGHARSPTTGPGVVGAEPSSADEASYFRMREGAARRLGAEIDRREAMLIGPTADPVAYVGQNPTIKTLAASIDPKDPSTFDRFATASLALQDHLGVPPEAQHVLTRGTAEGLVSKITTPGADARQSMQRLQSQFGASYPKVFSDLVSLGRLPSSYQAVAALPDPNDSQLLARALQQAPGGGDDGKKLESWNQRIVTATGAADAPQKLKAAINSSTILQSYLDSLKSQGVSAPQIDSITKDVETLGFAKVYWNKMDVASAADSAVDAFTKQFAFMPNGGARVPATSFDAVSADAAATLRDLDAGKLSIPPGFGGHMQPSVQDYVNAVRAAPTWIDAPKADGLLLLDHGGRLVRTGDGKPLMVPFARAGWIAATAQRGSDDPIPSAMYGGGN